MPRRSKSTQPRSSSVGRREVAGGRPPQDVRTPCHTPTRESHVCLHSWDCVRSGVRGSYKMTRGGILRRRKFVARRAWVRSNTPWGRGGPSLRPYNVSVRKLGQSPAWAVPVGRWGIYCEVLDHTLVYAPKNATVTGSGYPRPTHSRWSQPSWA